jgi:hypothetical protein
LRQSPLGKAWIKLELGSVVAIAIVIFLIAIRYGFDIPTFLFFWLPLYLVFVCIVALGIRVLRRPVPETFYQKVKSDTRWAYMLLGGGFIFWQLIQVGYFFRQGALEDFIHTYVTATNYYGSTVKLLWNGAGVVAVSGSTLLIALAMSVAVKKTADFGTRWKIICTTAAMLVALAVPVVWYIGLNAVYRYHFTVWAAVINVSLLVSLCIAYRDSRGITTRDDTTRLLSLLLVTIYATVNLLDAFTIIDTGHISQVLPAFVILVGFLMERFYNSWKNYLHRECPRIGRITAATMTGALVIGILLPSLFMMFMFRFIMIPTADRRWQLYQGELTPVPRAPVTLERARGISIHTLDGYIWIPPECPKTWRFFDVVRRITAITEENDTVFSTTGWSLMLYFLADRDSMSEEANCYVWQTVMGLTTSEALESFSDEELRGLIEREQPKVIVVEDEEVAYAIETKSFIRNWPKSWEFIMMNYRLREDIGPFDLYVPRNERVPEQ